MFGILRNLASSAKTVFNQLRAIVHPAPVKYGGPSFPVVTRRQQMALRLVAATAGHAVGRHSYIPPTFEFAHVEGKKDRSQKIRSNKRKHA